MRPFVKFFALCIRLHIFVVNADRNFRFGSQVGRSISHCTRVFMCSEKPNYVSTPEHTNGAAKRIVQTNVVMYVCNKMLYSDGLSLGVTPSEHCRKGWSDLDAVCVEDSGDPGKHLLHIAYRFGRILYRVHSTQYSLPVKYYSIVGTVRSLLTRYGTHRRMPHSTKRISSFTKACVVNIFPQTVTETASLERRRSKLINGSTIIIIIITELSSSHQFGLAYAFVILFSFQVIALLTSSLDWRMCHLQLQRPPCGTTTCVLGIQVLWLTEPL